MQFPEIDSPDISRQPIEFFFDDVVFNLPEEAALREWLMGIAQAEGKPIAEVNFIFCSDEQLRHINVEFLDHDYYTDIITFDFSDDEATMRGEIYISSERVTDNAREHGVSFLQELCRVMAHGVLHIAGYGDKTPEQEAKMRAKENYYLNDIKALID
ncbi:MAG: rRNA maturation RNase YbeY [Saprospiraceae bacterium]|nr:rRNA maturation RNase YbeY [Saprospiraceae bacterium]